MQFEANRSDMYPIMEEVIPGYNNWNDHLSYPTSYIQFYVVFTIP